MRVYLLVLALLVFISSAQYDDWKVYKGNDPTAFDEVMNSDDEDDKPIYVMYESAKLNLELKGSNGGAGMHVSVYPKTGKWDPYKPGHDIHSSWNVPKIGDRINDFHWGYVSGNWYQDTKLRHLKDNPRLSAKKKKKIPTQKELEPLKKAFDAFVKGKILGDDGTVKKGDDGNPIDIWEHAAQKTDVTKKKISKKFPAAAHEGYSNYYYDNYNHDSSASYNTKNSKSYPPHTHHHQYANHEDTESSSINVPTVVVTLISCMFLFILCVFYTGCVGLVGGAIGYKVKQSQQVHKEHSFQEI